MVDVFEKSRSVGGVWVLDDRVESDPLGQSGTRSTVHSSLYDSLRVNLPREAMSFSDFPFLPEFMKVRISTPKVFQICSRTLTLPHIRGTGAGTVTGCQTVSKPRRSP